MTQNKKEKVLTEQQKEFLAALLGEARGDFKKALEIAGYSKNTRPNDIISTLRDEIIEAAKGSLVLSSVKAAMELDDVMSNPSKAGAGNSLKAAESVLNRVGIGNKTGEDINLKVPTGGLFILPAKEVKEEDKENVV